MKKRSWRQRVPDAVKNRTRPLRRRATQMRVYLRALSRRERRLPSFLIIGAMKAGTTSLFRYLCDHPQIASPVVKEIDYFNFNGSRGAHWYAAHFPVAAGLAPGTVTGEASTGYLVHPHAARRARECIPAARVVVLLRDPVRRALSHYFHERRIGLETRPPDEALFSDAARTTFTLPASLEREWYDALSGSRRRRTAAAPLLAQCPMHLAYLTLSRYADYLPAWLGAFGKERVLILRSEDLFGDSEGQLARTLEFLELDAAPPAARPAHNVGKYPERVAPATLERLRGEFAEPNRRLRQLLGAEWRWDDCATPDIFRTQQDDC